MLSQRLAKAALALDAATSDDDRRRHCEELAQVLRTWSDAHDKLRRRDRASSIPGRNSAAVQAAFDVLEPSYARIHEAAERLIRNQSIPQPDPAALRADRTTILAVEGEFLVQMERIVGLYEQEARARIDG